MDAPTRPALSAFFRPPALRAELAILEAARALPAHSAGEITSALLTAGNDGAPEPDGALSERVFGPLRELACACGRIAGPEHGGERCPRCGVECTSSSARSERYGHVVAAGGLVHPRLGGLIARCLGWTEEQVWAVAYSRAYVEGGEILPVPEEEVDPRIEHSGPEVLQQLLSERDASAAGDASRWPAELAAAGFRPRDLILRVVPVTPPAERPLREVPGGARMPGLDSVRYQDLLAENHRLRAMRDRGGSLESYVRLQHAALQTAFEALCLQLGADADGEERLVPARRPGRAFTRVDRYWHPVPEPPVALTAPPERDDADDPELLDRVVRPTGCAFLDGDAALLCFPFAAVVVGLELEEAEMRAAHPIAPLRLVAATPDGSGAVLTQDGALFALDLGTGAWLPDAAGAPLAAVAERLEQAYLVDERRSVTAQAVEVQDYVARWAASPDGHLLWVEDRSGRGGVYAAATGLRQVDRAGWRLDVPVSELQADGTLVPAPDLDTWEDQLDELAERHGDRVDSAFALGADGQWRFLDLGLLVLGGTPVCRLAFQGTAAAFDAAGERLLVAGEEDLFLVDVSPAPRLRRRLSMRRVQAEIAKLGPPREPPGA
jgi:hypothetical protein